LFFNSLSFDEDYNRPFRLAKFTACRKKCAFLSVQQHEVKAACHKIAMPAGISSVSLQLKPRWGRKALAASVVASGNGLDDVESRTCVVARLVPATDPLTLSRVRGKVRVNRGGRDKPRHDPAGDG
jgi:hypothetical protein